MGQDLFDASVGLAFSLAAFERYQKSGLLQAELHHVPGVSGRCKGYLQITQGKVVGCYIEDKDGQRHSRQVSTLIQLDDERGPFGWTLTASPSQIEQTAVPPHHSANSPTPKLIALLDLEGLHGWTSEHKRILFQVYQMVNGQRSIEDIKHMLPLPSYVTDEALHVLSTLNVIKLS